MEKWRIGGPGRAAGCRLGSRSCAARRLVGWPAWGSGIASMEQSVPELGPAYAGAATDSGDGGAVSFNPGAMGGICGRLIGAAGFLITPSRQFRNQGSRLYPDLGGAPLTGNDESPVPNSRLRNPRIPDNDRFGLTVGVSYRIFDEVRGHDFSAHRFAQDAPSRRLGGTGDRLAGRFSESVDFLGVQLDWCFWS